MEMSLNRIGTIILILFLLIGGVYICSMGSEEYAFNINSVNYYTDIPGITDEEIAAIEALKTTRQRFSLGSMTSTESFVLPDGTNAGFIFMFCDLLSSLFGIPFVHEYHTWDSIKQGIENGTIDFTSELTHTPERRYFYQMSHPIAERSLGVFTYKDRIKIHEESDINDLRIGFYEGTITEESILDAYPDLVFETVPLKDQSDVVTMLESGLIDAFIADAVDSYTFVNNSDIIFNELFQLVYTPVSLTTGIAKFEPIISALNKYMEAGGIDKFHDYYLEGKHEYSKYRLNLMLSEDEKNYLDNLLSSNGTVSVIIENDHYPISFYNEKEREFQGIAPDILNEISKMTDIRFNIINDKDTSWGEMMEMLRTGKASILSQLLYSEERKGNFLWSLPYASCHYALLSKVDYPYLEMYQVIRAVVGTGGKSAYEDFYRKWFPENNNLILYESQNDMLVALEKGDIDLLMASDYILLDQINYREKPGYKANIIFNSPLEESLFGFNINEEILCSIIKKTQGFTNAAIIEKDWTTRTYDYSIKMANERSLYLSIFASILLMMLIILAILFIRTNRTREFYKKQALTLSAIYRSLPDLVYSKDLNGKYMNCNHSFEKFVGHLESEIIGKTPNEIYSHDMILTYRLMAMDKKVMKDRITLKAEGWYTFPDLSRRLFEIVKVPLIYEGKAIGLVGIDRDITKYKEAEKAAQEASRTKSNFLAKMSHEIRTPMNAIIGMTELALREKEIDSAHKHIYTVKQAGVHLLSIINDILDFSKIEMGKLEILPADYSFSSLINDVISIIRMRVIDSQIRFAVNIDSKIPDLMHGDETRIRQVLLNVLSNAVKYTEKGFISFTVYGDHLDEDTIMLNMEVMDSGKGIKPEDIKNLFGEYTQFDLDTNRGIEGVGLGLAISWNIIKSMGGDINVYSEYGKGSTFTITLPQKICSDEVLAVVDNASQINAIVYERREIYANSIMSTIDNLGVNCILVSDDEELLQKISLFPYDFIFISYNLLKNNKSAILKIRDNVKIVVLSEFGESIPDKNLSVLSMPVFSISLANVFNGISDNFNYNNNDQNIVRFTAPDAKVLIVDDIHTNLKVAEGLMLPYKMQIDLCHNGKDAIEAANINRYDIIFMDHKMPGMDGITATFYIRSLNKEDQYFKNVPIIALTANAVSGTKEMFLNNGFNDFLFKPIDTVKLNSVLERFIPKSKQKSISGEYLEVVKKKETSNMNDMIISGIDVKKGIFLSGGTINLYIETLIIFMNDVNKKIIDIRSCLESGDLPLFTIHVHALKSASANIGAMVLSEAAKDLEMAGDNKDPDYIEKHITRFISDLEQLSENINNAIELYRKDNVQNSNDYDINFIKIKLIELKDALGNLDAENINKIIDYLRTLSLPDKISEALQALADKILFGDYDDAISLIAELLEQN